MYIQYQTCHKNKQKEEPQQNYQLGRESNQPLGEGSGAETCFTDPNICSVTIKKRSLRYLYCFENMFNTFFYPNLFNLSLIFSIPLGLFGVAQLGAHWNLPVFSWVSDHLEHKDNNKYTTLVRLSGRLYAICK